MRLTFIFIFLAIASCSLIEQDPNFANLFDTDFVDSVTIYSTDFIRKIASERGASRPPIFDSFNEPKIRQQLRNNVLLLIDKMLSMQQNNMSSCAIQRLSEAKAIRDIYIDDAKFNGRPLPRYYHVTNRTWVPAILDSMIIKWTDALFPGAWFATGFYLQFKAKSYSPVFSFGSELEQPLNEVSNESHYIAYYGFRDYYGLGRMHDISMWKNNTDLISWGVEQEFVKNITNYIKLRYDEEKASFLLSKMTSIDQIVLERQLLTIAHAHTNDRANALLAGSFIDSSWTKSHKSAANISVGQIIVSGGAGFTPDMYYGMITSVDSIKEKISFLTLHIATRQTVLNTASLRSSLIIFNKYMPDMEIKDMTVLTQLIADGALLDQPPPSYTKLKRSVNQLMTRVKHVTLEEQRHNEIQSQKYHRMLCESPEHHAKAIEYLQQNFGLQHLSC